MHRLLSVKQNFKSAFRGAQLQNNGITSTNCCKVRCCCHYGVPCLHAIAVSRSQMQYSGRVPNTYLACSCHSALSLRYQSTTTNPEQLLEEKKKKKKPWKHYLELTEVTEKTANERRSPVKRLRAKKLQEFITMSNTELGNNYVDPAIELNEPPKIKKQPIEYQRINTEALESLGMLPEQYDEQPFIFLGKKYKTTASFDNPEQIQMILKSFTNFRDIIETINYERSESSEIYNPSLAKLDENVDIFDPPESSNVAVSKTNISNHKVKDATAVVSAKSKSRFKSRVHCTEEQEYLAKQRSLRINLAAYLNACVSTGLVLRGMSTLLAYRERDHKQLLYPKDLLNIELYNIMLHGFAADGSLARIKEICGLIEKDGISYNEQSFAAIFECMGRLDPTIEYNKIIEDCIRKAENLGITLNQIMDRSKFVSDQRETVLKAIQRIQPDFSPVYTPPELNYANQLLNHLNEPILSFDETEQKETSLDKDMPGTEIMNSKRGYTKEYLSNLAAEQFQIECDGSITIESIQKCNDFANADYCRKKLQELDVLWRKNILAAIVRDMNTLKAQTRYKPNGFMTYYTYLRVLDAEEYTDILINEIYKIAEGSETFSPTVRALYRELGSKVEQRHQINEKRRHGISEKIDIVYGKYCEKWDASTGSQTRDNTRQIWQRLVHEQRTTGPSMDINETSWPSSVLMGIGRFLFNILIRDVKIDLHIMRNQSQTKLQNYVPALYTLFRSQGRLVKEEAKPHPVLARLLRVSRQKMLTFDSNQVPMLCPPQPWTTPHTGGYLLNKSDLIRLPHQAVQQWERIKSANPQSIYPALDSLNQLASIAWRVNKNILDIIIDVFQKGGDRYLDVPQPPSSLPPLPTDTGQTITNAERAKLFKEHLGRRRKQAEMYSIWCDTLYRLSLANHYRDKVFWLPHNMDFRGRVYPMPPHLNHLGSDLARSILIFDQPKPLGPDGFNWLKLHCINLTGQKKRDSVAERMRYVEDVMEDILDSADRPLTGRMWWANSDEPWQTLACCQEIAKVHRSPNPETYLCHFPIHQDGSCNGLQHYAALGRDAGGAINVNLAPSERPQDVYSAVAGLVEKTRAEDAKNGLHVAEILSGFVKRKVIKQTVMTTVYGVTRYGARLQIARQLKDIDDFPKDWVWPASSYLTTKTFESLREMFTSTREIQDWFTNSARLISSAGQQNVEWRTPLGFPVVQPYSFVEPKYKTRTGTHVGTTESMDMYERPNVIKQKNAFPPNFIHSLDSSHMMLTSLHCERKGLTFVSVHDCFWTHASTVPAMNKICREQFVALHSQPILENLAKFLKDNYTLQNEQKTEEEANEFNYKLNQILQQLPKKGDFELHNVLDSIYFFS